MTDNGERVSLGARPGSHTAYIGDDGRVVVEWYDFGPHAPYESANLLDFDAAAQAALAKQLDLPPSADANALIRAIASRFDSYFEVRRFADGAGIAYRHRVDFMP
jgi:hypothetical protein